MTLRRNRMRVPCDRADAVVVGFSAPNAEREGGQLAYCHNQDNRARHAQTRAARAKQDCILK